MLRSVWEEFAEFVTFTAKTFSGDECHDITEKHTKDDWVIRHRRCPEEGEVIIGKDGLRMCQLCFSLGSDKKICIDLASSY